MPEPESTQEIIRRTLLNSKPPRRFVGTRTIVVGLLVVILAVWGLWATSTSAAPRLSLEQVALTEWYDSLMEPSAVMLDGTGWSDAEVVQMVSKALVATMHPTSAGTWRPGFEAHLALKGFSDVQIRAAVLRAYATISIEVADAVFAELGKPQ